MGHRIDRYYSKCIADMAKKRPEMVDSLKEIDEKAYAYAKGVQRNEAMVLCQDLAQNKMRNFSL